MTFRLGLLSTAVGAPAPPRLQPAHLEASGRSQEYIRSMTNHQPDSALLSAQEAADALCVSAQTVREWIADGTLPVQHVGDRPVIRRDDVEKVQRSKIWMTPSAAAIWAPA